jgi:ubiquitin-like 1-activating enzyme E1 A
MVEEISVQEVALYDRQIRLWGMDAQTRMRSTHVLVVGLNGLSNEVVKNLVLAGIGSLTILCDSMVGEVGCQFFTRAEDTGYKLDHAVPRIRALNPTVKVIADTRSWKEIDSDYFKQFQIVLLCSGNQDDLVNNFINSR